MESISKSRIQGVWDPAHSTRMVIIAHSTQVGIPSGCRHYIQLPPTFHPGCPHPKFCYRPHSTRMFYIQNSAAAVIPPGCLTPDRRGERFNFLGHTYPDPLIALTRIVSQPFCTVSRCSPEASRYV